MGGEEKRRIFLDCNDTSMENKPSITNLFSQISSLLEQARHKVLNQVNTTMVQTYFEIGKIIVEDEQKGKEKAEYGKETLKKLSQQLTSKFGKGFSVQNIERMRLFYLTFQKSSTLSRKLSWSHYVRLLTFADQPLKLDFYLAQSEKSNWSYRELNRQIKSALFERVALSSDKSAVIQENIKKYHNPEKTKDIIKDPYIFEFLWLKEKDSYSESDVEKSYFG